MEKKELRKYIRELKRRYTPEEKREMSYPLWKKLESELSVYKGWFPHLHSGVFQK